MHNLHRPTLKNYFHQVSKESYLYRRTNNLCKKTYESTYQLFTNPSNSDYYRGNSARRELRICSTRCYHLQDLLRRLSRCQFAGELCSQIDQDGLEIRKRPRCDLSQYQVRYSLYRDDKMGRGVKG